jgi:hypothetical protein
MLDRMGETNRNEVSRSGATGRTAFLLTLPRSALRSP